MAPRCTAATRVELSFEVRAQARRKEGRAVVLTLATADHELAAVDVDVRMLRHSESRRPLP
jgi:hypothetical protein